MGEGEGTTGPWTLDLWSWHRGIQVGAVTPLPYPDVFKHLHGTKGLEGADKTLWVTEASNNVWDPWKERLSPPFQELPSVRKGEGSVGPLHQPPASSSSPKSLSQLSILGSQPAHPHPEPVEALPLARAVHLLGGLELHIAAGGLCGWGLGVYAVYLPGEEQRMVSQAAA